MSKFFPTVVIENLSPQIEGGRYPIKRVPGEEVTVSADVFKEGHDVVLAVLKWRSVGEKKWREVPMIPVGNDRWRGSFYVGPVGFAEYTIEAWGDALALGSRRLKRSQGGGESPFRDP